MNKFNALEFALIGAIGFGAGATIYGLIALGIAVFS